MGFPDGSVGKESTSDTGDLGSRPGLGRSPGGGHGNTLQYSCLENLMDRGAWRVTVHGVARVRHDLATKPPHVCVCVCVCVSDFFLSIHLSMDVFSDTLIIVNNTIVNVGVLKKKL